MNVFVVVKHRHLPRIGPGFCSSLEAFPSIRLARSLNPAGLSPFLRRLAMNRPIRGFTGNDSRGKRDMSFLERSSTHSAQGPSPAQQPHPKTIWFSAKQMTRLAILAAIAGVCLFGYSGRHVLAKTGQAADAKDAASAVDPNAVDAVKKWAPIFAPSRSSGCTETSPTMMSSRTD